MKLKEKHILIIAGFILLLAIIIVILMYVRRINTLVAISGNISGLMDAVSIYLPVRYSCG